MLDNLATFGLRTVPSVAGTIGGGFVGSVVPVAGTAAGAVAGGASGGALGEWLAQKYEKARGLRDDTNLTSVATAGALGAIPLGKAGGILANVGKGALMGGGGTAAMDLSEGRDLDLGRVATGATFGGAFGGGTAALAKMLRGKPSVNVKPDISDAAVTPVKPSDTPAGTVTPAPQEPFNSPRIVPVRERPRETPLPPGAVKRVADDAADVQTWAETNPAKQPGHQTIKDITAAARLRPIRPGDDGTEAGPFAPKFVAYAAERAKARSAYDTAVASGDHDAVAEAATALSKARQHEIHMASDFGRNLRVTQEQAQRFMTLADDGIDRAIKAGMPEQDVADLLAKAGNDPDQWIRGLRAAEAAHQTAWQQFKTYQHANILSGAAQVRNVVGNVVNAATKVPMTALEAGVDAVRVARHGGERVTTLGEVGAQARAIPGALKKGAAEAGEILRKGYSAASGDLSALDQNFAELKGVLKPLNSVGRLMKATDALFRALSSEMELAGQMHTGKVSTPTPAMIAQAKETGLRATYQEAPGETASALMHLKEEKPGDTAIQTFLRRALDQVALYMKTPSNILKQGFEYTLAGFFMKGAKASEVGQRTANAVTARAVAGTAALAPLFGLALSGRLTGAGPTDPAKRAEWMESGKRPNSIKLPGTDTWVSYAPLSHLAIPAAMVANAVEVATRRAEADPNGQIDPDAILAMLFDTGLAMAGSVLQQSYLSQAGALVAALNDRGGASDKMATFMGRTAGSVVPFSGLLRGVAQTIDPVVRRPDPGSITDVMKANLPGLSKSVTPRLDRFGQPVTRTANPANVFNPSPETHDPVAAALKRTGVNLMPARPDKDVRFGRNSAPLNKADALALGQNKGQALYDLLLPVISQPGFNARPVEQQKDLIERLIQRARAVEEQKAAASVFRGQPVSRR